MKSFSKLIFLVVSLMILLAAGANLFLLKGTAPQGGEARVEIERAKADIREGTQIKNGSYEHIIGIYKYDGSEDFFETKNRYEVFASGADIYRIDYKEDNSSQPQKMALITVNISILAFALITLSVLVYIRRNIIVPFDKLSDTPIELAKGNLSAPVKESRSRYFGRYVWGTDMLRETMIKQRERELAAARDKQTLMLSLSHDIKTPLSAIKLYSKALEKGLYDEPERLSEIYHSINDKADEIEGYLVKLSQAAREDFLSLEVNLSEEYLSSVIERTKKLYSERLSLLGTEFSVGEFSDCIIKCDPDRACEVLENLMENAIKYGDGRYIGLTFSDEEDCRLVAVQNSGCTLNEDELLHIFESFYRGSNVGSNQGSGLGLYIARQLMIKMGGDIFAEIKDGNMNITLVFTR